MMKFIESYRLLITPLSPLHIGTGESYEPTNYVIDDDVLYEFDTGSMVDAFSAGDREALLKISARTPDADMITAIQRFIYEKRGQLMPHAVNRIPALSGVATLYSNRIGRAANLEASGKKVLNRLEIDRTGFDPVARLPVLYGSSLKGAIRTALLDRINKGEPLQKKSDLRTGRVRDENNMELQWRLFRFRSGKFELDPLRLLQLGDAVWAGEVGLPASQVFLAVNRKKSPIRDEQGRLRKSQAEGKDLYQILECVPAWRYRTFTAQLTLQSISGLTGKQGDKLPADDLRFGIVDIAGACNRFYRPILESDNRLMRERGYLDNTWDKAVQKLLKMSAERMERGDAFLLRVGRHSSAESVTLNGVRNIKINKGKGQQPEFRKEAKTLWFASEEIDQSSGLLPFGWILVEVVRSSSEVHDWPELQSLCECDPYLRQARSFAAHIAGRQTELEKLRTETDAKRRAEEEHRLAEEVRLRQIEEKRKKKEEEDSRIRAEWESLSEEERLVRTPTLPDVTEHQVVECFNKLDMLASPYKESLAKALKEYYVKAGKWDGGSRKQIEKVRKLKAVLGDGK